ncbi:MAG: LytR/AlgR family response regulator transcription factor, partial [Clostridium sp.]
YKVSAYRYLLKPIIEEVFHSELNGLLSSMNKEKTCISASKEGCMIKVLISEITYMEISERKISIHTDKDVYFSNLSIDYWNGVLANHNFAKPHNSYLVNLNHIIALDKEKITLSDGYNLYMSKRKYKEFKDVFTVFLGTL